MRSGVLSLFVLLTFLAGAQVDLEEAAKKKLEQQDFNTTRNNKDRNSINAPRKKAKKMHASESAPPPPPPAAPAPDTLKDLLLQSDAFVAYELFIESTEDVKFFIGRDFAILQSKGSNQFTVYDFGRSRIIVADTVAKPMKSIRLNPY